MARLGTNRSRSQRAAGLVLVAGALGCGGRADSDPPRGDLVPSAYPPMPSSAPSPVAEPPGPSFVGPPAEASPVSPPSTRLPADAEGLDEIVDYVAPIDEVLRTNCGSCHGPAAPAAGSGGIRFIDDVDQLVAAGLIVPLNSAASRIVVVSALGSMPPPSSGMPKMTEADLRIVIAFIDNPRYWPELPWPVAMDAGTAPPAVDAGVDGG